MKKKKHSVRWEHVTIWMVVIVLTISAVAVLLCIMPQDSQEVDVLLTEEGKIIIETETELSVPLNPVPKPEIDEQLLPINPYSRPGEEVDRIEKIVIHYLANPNTSAQQNHDYFESLKDLKDISMSANYIVGTDGEIIECVPPGEIAYASNEMNKSSVSIENCHLDSSGRFTEKTYDTLVRLTAWLVAEYELDRDDIIRHYDVTGKECPVYYVEHEDKWEAFKDDVISYIQEYEK